MVWNHVCVFCKIFEIPYLPWKVTWVVWYYWNVQSTRLSSTGVAIETSSDSQGTDLHQIAERTRPKRDCSSSKHQFSGVFAVSFREGSAWIWRFCPPLVLWFDFVLSFGSGAMTSIFYSAINGNLSLLQTFANQPSMAEQPYTLAWSFSMYLSCPTFNPKVMLCHVFFSK